MSANCYVSQAVSYAVAHAVIEAVMCGRFEAEVWSADGLVDVGVHMVSNLMGHRTKRI